MEPKDPGVRLIGVGLQKSKPADDIQPGDVLVWNYGFFDEVVAVEQVSEHYLRVDLCDDKGNLSQRRIKRGRRVAWSPRETSQRRERRAADADATMRAQWNAIFNAMTPEQRRDAIGEDGDARRLAHLHSAAADLALALPDVLGYYCDPNAPFEDEDERRIVAAAERALKKASGGERDDEDDEDARLRQQNEAAYDAMMRPGYGTEREQ